MNGHPLDAIVEAQHRGEPRGITSVCSANPTVLEATVRHGAVDDGPVLIEATCNQVNQYGGYTGMTAVDFRRFVEMLALDANLPLDRLILGGDHLGPNPWKTESAEIAMAKADVLVRSFVAAGYTKIHIDASMRLGDDDRTLPLDPGTIASRAAALVVAAEDELERSGSATAPRYVIGTEVPVPGGAEAGEEELSVTTVDAVAETIELHRVAFAAAGLDDAWRRVVGVVTQPGVEFADREIHEYDPAQAAHLARFAESLDGLVFEAHSTDYQTPEALRNLVRDHFAILKVGPGLTFAYREGVFALSHIEDEMFGNAASGICDVIESVMLDQPETWAPYYSGTDQELAFARKYSFSDRVRYVLPDARIVSALEQMIGNLSTLEIPWPLLSQYVPEQYRRIRAGALAPDPEEILLDKVRVVLDDYASAT
jgi:D-tagatose-1,6-bisphosphate aldolase subunit GatZ/KbaZ